MNQESKSWIARWSATVVGGPVAGILGLFLSKIIDSWGVLDAPANALGETLKANVSGGHVSLWLGFLLFAVLYGLLLRKVWGVRLVHHVTLQTETEPKPSLAMQVQRAAPVTPPPPKLTVVDRERVAEMMRDVHDFMGAQVEPFRNKLVIAVCGTDPPALGDLEALKPRQRELDIAALELFQRHLHYLELINLDIMPLLRGISNLQQPMAGAVEAIDWPAAAQTPRTDALNTAFSALGGDINAIRDSIAQKRKEYL